MLLRDDELMGLRVETTTGMRVGRVMGFVMELETNTVIQYRVRPRSFLAAILPGMRELLIHQRQVVSMDAHRMIIQEAGTSAPIGGGRKRVLAPIERPQAVATAVPAPPDASA